MLNEHNYAGSQELIKQAEFMLTEGNGNIPQVMMALIETIYKQGDNRGQMHIKGIDKFAQMLTVAQTVVTVIFHFLTF
ncbi:MAG: hypothetical protein JWR12_3125 [Mucilaginibacter sp.]|nr:hypothetical protein [Mucilaginibacter sp.]